MATQSIDGLTAEVSQETIIRQIIDAHKSQFSAEQKDKAFVSEVDDLVKKVADEFLVLTSNDPTTKIRSKWTIFNWNKAIDRISNETTILISNPIDIGKYTTNIFLTALDTNAIHLISSYLLTGKPQQNDDAPGLIEKNIASHAAGRLTALIENHFANWDKMKEDVQQQEYSNPETNIQTKALPTIVVTELNRGTIPQTEDSCIAISLAAISNDSGEIGSASMVIPLPSSQFNEFNHSETCSPTSICLSALAKSARFNVRAILKFFEISLEELIALKSGATLPIHSISIDNVPLLADANQDFELARGSLVSNSGLKAMRITEVN